MGKYNLDWLDNEEFENLVQAPYVKIFNSSWWNGSREATLTFK